MTLVKSSSTTTLLVNPFNSLFSRKTLVSQHQKDQPFWILLEQEMMGASGINWSICKSFAPYSRQITMPVPHHSVFYRPDALPAARPTASKCWRHVTSSSKLPLFSAGSIVMFLALECRRLWLVPVCTVPWTEEIHVCEQLALGWRMTAERMGIELATSTLLVQPATYSVTRPLWRQNIKLVSLWGMEKPVWEIRRCGDCWPLHEKFSCEKIELYDHCFILSEWVLSDCSLTVYGMLKACTVCWSNWHRQELLCTAEADEWPVVWLLLTNIR